MEARLESRQERANMEEFQGGCSRYVEMQKWMSKSISMPPDGAMPMSSLWNPSSCWYCLESHLPRCKNKHLAEGTSKVCHEVAQINQAKVWRPEDGLHTAKRNRHIQLVNALLRVV